MGSLLEEFRGAVDLIYIDPPFDVGADFTMEIPLGDEKDKIDKQQSVMEMVAYRDMWGRGSNSYLQMIFERLSIMKQLLSDRGSIYIHIGPNIDHLVRSVCDEVFGASNFIN
jgi:adenine specific DNA methylase Mod